MGADSRMQNGMQEDESMGQDDDDYLLESDEDGCCYVPPPQETEPFTPEHPLQWRADPPQEQQMGASY